MVNKEIAYIVIPNININDVSWIVMNIYETEMVITQCLPATEEMCIII